MHWRLGLRLGLGLGPSVGRGGAPVGMVAVPVGGESGVRDRVLEVGVVVEDLPSWRRG